MTMFSLHLLLRNLLENLGFDEPLLATLAQESPQDFFDVLSSEAVRTEIGGLPDLLSLHQPELLALRLRLRAGGPRPAQRASILPLVPYVSAAPAYSSTTSSTSASPPITSSPPARAWTRPSKIRRTTTSATISVHQWEQQLQTYWLQRLGAIKAALAPTVAMPPPFFSNADIEVLELGGGAWRTIQAHVRRWERYHTSIGNHPHPFTTEPLLAYLLQMERATCGPTVIPSFCATVRWLSGRLRVPAPDLPSHFVSRLQERLLERRGVETRDIKEAPALDVEHVRALENLVIECSATNVFKSTFAWKCLVMTWASMRFDDALHTCPSTVYLRDEGLHLTAWQTKVDRVRRGTRYAVPKASLGQEDWVTTGYGCWFTVGTDDYRAGDHWLYDVGDFNCFNPNVITNDVFVTSLKRVLYEATMTFAPESQR